MSSSTSTLFSMVDMAFEGGLLVDESGRLIHMNSAAEGLFEFALKDGATRDISEVMVLEGDDGPVPWQKTMEDLEQQPKSIKWMGYGMKQSGDKFDADVHGTLSVMNEGGEIKKTVVFFLKPAEAETRFDHMTRYMSTLLNMLTSIIETSLDPIFQISEDGTIQMVNEAAVRNFGWTRDEFIGGNVRMLCGGDHSAKHDSYLQKYIETGVTKVMGKKRELPARRKDGSEFPIELGLVEIYNDTTQERMFVGFIRDLTEIKKRERLSTGIIQAAFDPMFNIDSRGVIEFVNDAAIKEFGYTREEFLGSNISCIVGSEHCAKHDAYIKRYLETGEARVMGKKRPLNARRKDGSEFPIELGLTEIQTNKGEERIFCGFVRNLAYSP